MISNSLQALADALLEEIDRMHLSRSHEAIEVTCNSTSLPNGIRCCSVQIECDKGCGWRIESYGHEAKVLESRARDIQQALRQGIFSSGSPSVIIIELFPELACEGQIKQAAEI